MKHHAFAAVGLLTAAFLVQGAPSHAATADPTGFWVKPGSERNAKIQVRKCGKGLCANIVWLENPNDSKGKPLRDVRNENPSLRGRSIVGLPIFTGLAPSAPGVWTGKIYNPEDGNTYSVTLTVVSRQQLKLKGCKGWVMCGERMWLRTSPPPAEPKPDETIEASVKPDADKPEAPAVAEAKAESAAAEKPAPTVQAAATPAAEPPAPMGLAEETEMMAGAAPVRAVQEPVTPEQHARSGYRFLNASVTPETARYSGESVPSMFVMTKPMATEAVATPAPAAASAAATAAVETDASAPAPSPKPKPSIQAAAAPKPAGLKPAGEAKPVRQAAPAPQDTAGAEASAAETGSETAATPPPPNQQASVDETAQPPLTRRQKRLLRRQQMMGQQQPFFPWLRGQN